MSLKPMEGYVKGLKVHASHYGYHPDHPKRVICTQMTGESHFEVIDAVSGAPAFRAPLAAVDDDFGHLLVGDFSDFTAEGEYYIRVGGERSFGTFRIKAHLWDEYQKLIAIRYFGIRRIGEDNIVGNLGDFHGVRWDDALLPNGEGWRYIGRSFCDGDDRRVYPSVSLVVAQYCALARSKPFWDSGDWIYAQVRWGLDGTLSFLDKDGILRRALYAFPDDNTDGRFYSGDEKRLGDAFDQTVTCNEYGLANREIVYASLLLGPAEAVVTYRDRDPEFFDRVAKLCEIGYARIEQMFQPFQEAGFRLPGHDFSPFAGKYSAAAWVWLSALMHQITGREEYLAKAVAHADMLRQVQQAEPLGDDRVSLSGWYRKSGSSAANPWGEKPEQEVMITPWIYQGLFRLLELNPRHPDATAWKSSIGRYARDYLLPASRLNAFGHTPMKVGSAGLKRQRGSLSYQYFASVGRMFHQIGNAALLMQAGSALEDAELTRAGWQQIQWYAGVNPLGIGCIYGLSANIPSGQYHSKSFGRCIDGGTKNGMTGDTDDRPEVRFWEYYTYANLNALWFATTIGSERFAQPLEIWPRSTREAVHDPTDASAERATFAVRLKGGFAYRFAAMRAPDVPVRWSVDGVGDTGTIDDQGVYRAPFVTEPKTVRVTARSAQHRNVSDATDVTIMPVPQRVEDVRCESAAEGVRISWRPLEVNCTGYTIWRRLPIGPGEVGTIFERIWAVPASASSTVCPVYAPEGTEFLIKAYHMTEDQIYGFGPPSAVVTSQGELGR